MCAHAYYTFACGLESQGRSQRVESSFLHVCECFSVLDESITYLVAQAQNSVKRGIPHTGRKKRDTMAGGVGAEEGHHDAPENAPDTTTSAPAPAGIEHLTQELLFVIFSYLPAEDLARAGRVCQACLSMLMFVQCTRAGAHQICSSVRCKCTV